jgi:flagellar biosynthesis protein FliQ
MSVQLAIELTNQAMMIALQLAFPILITTMVVGVVINIFQTVTSIKDQSLSFVPKMLAAALVTGISMPWGIQLISGYFRELYQMLGTMSP